MDRESKRRDWVKKWDKSICLTFSSQTWGELKVTPEIKTVMFFVFHWSKRNWNTQADSESVLATMCTLVHSHSNKDTNTHFCFGRTHTLKYWTCNPGWLLPGFFPCAEDSYEGTKKKTKKKKKKNTISDRGTGRQIDLKPCGFLK